MKALSISELDEFVSSLQPLIGAELGGCLISNRDIAFELRKGPLRTWVGVDVNSHFPFIYSREALPFAIPKQKLPMSLFLKANFSGAQLYSIRRVSRWGRVLVFEFKFEEAFGHFEFHLFPRGSNMLAQVGDKEMALKKPKPLVEFVSEEPTAKTQEPVRVLEDVYQYWLSRRTNEKPNSSRKLGLTRAQKIKKLEKAIIKIEMSTEEKSQLKWKQCGDLLVSSQSLPRAFEDFPELLKRDQSLAWNIENCFQSHKKRELKQKGTQDRLISLKKELTELEQMSDEVFQKSQKKALESQFLSSKKKGGSSLRARSLKLDSGLQVSVGKSAQDNLALLRKARPWDYWLHLKDFPSAHAILFRNKKQIISESDFLAAAQFLVKVSTEKNRGLQLGEKVGVIMAESRFVSPIKGDSLGRVTFKNEKVLSIISS